MAESRAGGRAAVPPADPFGLTPEEACPPGTVNNIADLLPWVALARQLSATNSGRTNTPNYSGFVSLELEACAGLDVVKLRIDRFLQAAEPTGG